MSLTIKTLSLLSLLTVFSTSIVFAQKKAGKGGLSGSGGGGGVICFTKLEDALESDKWLTKNLQLPKAMLDKGRLQVLETWEMDNTNQPIWTAESGTTWEEHLEKVKNAIRDRFPLFMYRVDQTADWIKYTSWEDVPNLQVLDDAEPMVPIPETCRRVQLVLRFSEGNNSVGQGPVSEAPRIRIVFVKEYFSRLSPTDQAVLMFHEQLYILAQAVGHNSSDVIRGFIRLFFANSINYTASRESLIFRSPSEKMIRSYLITFLGDYIVYFHKSSSLNPGTVFSAQRHFYVYLQMMLHLREKVVKCLATAKKLGASDSECMPDTMRKFEVSEDVKNEDAFIFFVVHGLEDRMSFNGDQIMDPTGRNPDLFELSMKTMCSAISKNGNMKFSMVKKSMDYCKEWTSFHYPRK